MTDKDDKDVEKERIALSVRENMLLPRFARFIDTVKIILLKTFWTSLY